MVLHSNSIKLNNMKFIIIDNNETQCVPVKEMLQEIINYGEKHTQEGIAGTYEREITISHTLMQVLDKLKKMRENF